MIEKIRKFFGEVIGELRKVSWSTKQEIIDSTWIVIISSLFLGLFIGAADVILSRVLNLLIK